MQIALQPLLARSPAELVAANVAAGTGGGHWHVRRAGSERGCSLRLAGPVGSSLAILAIYALAVASIAGMRVPPTRRGRTPSVRKGLGGRCSSGPAEPRTALVLAGFCIQAGVRGALIVLTVVAAMELSESATRGRAC